MSYIYVITNNINNKQYVGKTNDTIENRFKRHIWDANKTTSEKRPLYVAMNKYGTEHFSIEQLEECSPEEAPIKEIYWIGKLDTYKNGYNATLGGDSKHYYDYQEIANKYLELQNQKETAKYFNCDRHTVRIACRACGVPIKDSHQIIKEQKGKSVQMINPNNGNIIKTFTDMSDAGRWLVNQGITNAQIKHISSNIGRAASGNRKTAYKYIWKFC